VARATSSGSQLTLTFLTPVTWLDRHVHDVARAFEAVLHRGVIGDVYNIGTTKEKTVMEVAHTICRYFNLKPEDTIEQVLL